MAQKKLKPKVKPPKNVTLKKTAKKGSAITKRANRPVQSKKDITEVRKLKQAVNKTVNKAVEEEIRSRASSSSNKNLSKAQQAVAAFHKKTAGSSK